MQVIPVKTKHDLKRFIKLPFQLYKDDPNWVPPLIMDQKNFFNPRKNPYYDHSEVQLFLVENNNRILGRISAQTNTQHNKFHNDKIGFFGFFECVEDQEVVDLLVETAFEWLRQKGCDTMRGPMNLSTNDELGLLIDGFDTPPYVMMPHTKKYYLGLLENAGLEKSMDLFAYELPVTEPPERLSRLTRKLQKRGNFTVRSLSKNKKEKKKDLETIFTIYRKAWERNWGFVPMTDKEFEHTVATILPIADPDLIFIAEVDGEPSGFSVTLPDYNFVLKKMKGKLFPFGLFKALYFKNKIKRVRVITMGVIKEFQNRGIDVVFYHKSYETAYNHKQKFTMGEISWILENNEMMNRVANTLGGKKHKTYRIFDKIID